MENILLFGYEECSKQMIKLLFLPNYSWFMQTFQINRLKLQTNYYYLTHIWYCADFQKLSKLWKIFVLWTVILFLSWFSYGWRYFSFNLNFPLILYCGPNGPTASIFYGIWINQSVAMVFIFNLDNLSLKKLFPTMNI